MPAGNENTSRNPRITSGLACPDKLRKKQGHCIHSAAVLDAFELLLCVPTSLYGMRYVTHTIRVPSHCFSVLVMVTASVQQQQSQQQQQRDVHVLWKDTACPSTHCFGHRIMRSCLFKATLNTSSTFLPSRSRFSNDVPVSKTASIPKTADALELASRFVYVLVSISVHMHLMRCRNLSHRMHADAGGMRLRT